MVDQDLAPVTHPIISITDANEGRIVKVKGHLYRNCFANYQNTFETTGEPDYLVELSDDAAVGVLQSKEWFGWDDNSKPQARLLSSVRGSPCKTTCH
jgi:fatty acid synthase subunit alpha